MSQSENPLKILVINPGSTSTKVAYFEDEIRLWHEDIFYTQEQLAKFDSYLDQADLRKKDIEDLVKNHNLEFAKLTAIAARGGPFKPLASGTYAIDEELISDIRNRKVRADHISNVAALIAYELGKEHQLPAYFTDPVSVDEFDPVARISGFAGIERQSLLHALNIKAVARIAAADLKQSLDDLNLIVCHLGGGISICAMKQGQMVDVNNANEEGPFSPERAGTIPASSLAKYCFTQNKSYEEIKRMIVGKGGLAGLLGTSDLREVEAQIYAGDDRAEHVLRAMAYQIAKEIGAMSTVLLGKVDGIVMTGGVARCQLLIDWVEERTKFIAPILHYPGEREMEALAAGVRRVLTGEEEAKKYV